jgi:flagellar motor switch protein FliM
VNIVEPILSKKEIDDLISAIKENRISPDLDNREILPVQQIDCSELDLFQVSNQRGDNIRIPNFDIILDAFSQNFSISLSNQLQRTFSITRVGLESMPFQEYLLSKDNPGSIGVLNLSPLKHGALIQFDPSLSFSTIEIMLGASIDLDLLELDRTLTKIELNVLRALMKKACDDLDRAFRPITRLESSLIKVENNPRLVSITNPKSEVIIGTFDVTVGEQHGVMELVFPLATLDPFREEFKDLLSVSSLKHGGWTDILIEELKDMTTTVIAQSGVIELPVGHVLGLKNGDIIPLDYDLNSSLRVLVEEKLKFFAQPGVHRGKKAISLTTICT